MDALKSNLAQRASVYNDAAKKFSFLTKLDATEEIREVVVLYAKHILKMWRTQACSSIC